MEDVEVRFFPLTYEQVVDAGPWEGPLYGKYQICETGCGRGAPDNCIFCLYCYDDFKRIKFHDAGARLEWLDGHRQRNLMSRAPGEQTTLWVGMI